MATQVPNRRLVRDAALTFTQALPAAGGNNTSASFDLGAGPFLPDQIDIEIAFPACAANTSTGDTYTVQLYDSADNSSFAAVVPGESLVVAGVVSTGSAAKVVTIKLPRNVRRYVSFYTVATSGTGNNTAQLSTFSILS